MEVLMLTYNDWSNTGWRFSKCLELLGIEVQIYKGKRHGFGYPKQAPIHKDIARGLIKTRFPVVIDAPELKPIVEQAKIVHFTASTFINTGADLSNKHVIVQHGGTTYRKEPILTNSFFNPITNNTIIQCPDLYGLGANNEVLIYYPVDTSLLKPVFSCSDPNKLIIGHFPSTSKVKGTGVILKVINKLRRDNKINNKFKYIGVENSANLGRVSWTKHLKRVSKCDILIETLNLTQNAAGKHLVFGEWGNQAIEAASLGKIVVTNSLEVDLYKKEYGDCALNITNTKHDLNIQLRSIIDMNNKALLKKKKETRKWVVRNHSMKATAIRLWEKVYCNLFNGKRKLSIERRVNDLRKEVLIDYD